MRFKEPIYAYTVKQMDRLIEYNAESNMLSEKGHFLHFHQNGSNNPSFLFFPYLSSGQESARFISTMMSTGYSCGGLMDALLLGGWIREQTQSLSISLPPELVMLFGKWPSKDCAHWMEVITAADCNMDNVVENNKSLMNKEIVSHIQTLWKEDAIDHAYGDLYQEYLIENRAGYFFSEISQIAADDYIPNEEDILEVPFRGVPSIKR